MTYAQVYRMCKQAALQKRAETWFESLGKMDQDVGIGATSDLTSTRGFYNDEFNGITDKNKHLYDGLQLPSDRAEMLRSLVPPYNTVNNARWVLTTQLTNSNNAGKFYPLDSMPYEALHKILNKASLYKLLKYRETGVPTPMKVDQVDPELRKKIQGISDEQLQRLLDVAKTQNKGTKALPKYAALQKRAEENPLLLGYPNFLTTRFEQLSGGADLEKFIEHETARRGKAIEAPLAYTQTLVRGDNLPGHQVPAQWLKNPAYYDLARKVMARLGAKLFGGNTQSRQQEAYDNFYNSGKMNVNHFLEGGFPSDEIKYPKVPEWVPEDSRQLFETYQKMMGQNKGQQGKTMPC